MTMRSKVSTMGLPVCVCRKLGFLLLVPGVQHLLRLVCEALRIVLRIGAMEFSCVRILQIVWSRRLRTLPAGLSRSEEHTSELQSRLHLVCRLLLEKKKKKIRNILCTNYIV